MPANFQDWELSRRQFMALAGSGALAAAGVSPRPVIALQNSASTTSSTSLVQSVSNLGSQFTDNGVGITGMDGATSTRLPSGGALWLFGDTVEGPFESIHGLPLKDLNASTAAIVPDQNASEGIKQFEFLKDREGKRPRQIVPFASDEDPAIHRVWPIHGVCRGDEMFLFYHRISLLKGIDVFDNFRLDGMGIARGKIGEFKFERIVANDGTREFWKGDKPTFGVFIESADDFVYLWGSLMTGMHLARTRLAKIEDVASYEYLAEAPTAASPKVKPKWSKTFQPSASLFDSVPNEMSAAYNRHLGKFVAFHTLNREHKIVMRTAPQRTGPWSSPQIVYRPPLIKDTDMVYAAKEHPELARENGRVLYVTYVNSTTYIPQLIEITLT
jgi:hypothetical protein